LEDDPALVDPTWVDKLLKFLGSDGVAMFLLLIGGAAVYAELQTPGVGLGGMVAFVCFLLFFWAKVFQGTAGALEVLLFVAGLACLVIEVFVLPGIGMGIFALGGGLMIIISLVLASQTFILPRNSYQLVQMRNSMLVVGGAALGTIAAVAGLRRWLPHTPLFNRMLLEPPSPEEIEDIDHREALVNYEHLLGQKGSAVTRLAPSGKAQVGDELVDVITEGEFIDRGSAIVVTEVRGNRVVVASALA
jgi:membrane-bound ClpP family serine protease